MKKTRKIVIILVIMVALILAGLVTGYIFLKNKYNKITYKALDETDLSVTVNTDDVAQINSENSIKFVIFGSDSRDESDSYAGRSDTIIIVVINTEEKYVNLISIPRDTYVEVPGYGMTKINHAYAYGQEQLSIKTINSYFGLDLTQYITIDFSGLVNCIDIVGGVELTLTQEEVEFINKSMTEENKITSAGTVTLNGTQALAHSRNRTVGNDFARATRQRDILVSLMKKVSAMSKTEILDLSDEILVNLTTNMDIDKYEEIFLNLIEDTSEYTQNINSIQIPSTDYGYDYWLDGIYYFGFDYDSAISDFNKYYYGIEE